MVEVVADGSTSWPRSIRLSSLIVAFSNECDISLISLDMMCFFLWKEGKKEKKVRFRFIFPFWRFKSLFTIYYNEMYIY